MPLDVLHAVQHALFEARNAVMARVAAAALDRAHAVLARVAADAAARFDQPKFGRGKVIASVARRIEVEFADGTHTLVHAPPSK